MNCIYRDQISKSWMICPIAEVAPGMMTNDVVDVLQDVVHQKIAFSQPPPVTHSVGPRAELVMEC